ncbi:MAG TPA: hypothetical protein VEW74_02875, partial [Candidatus Nitrosotalea sp.]|nr:hypothetical protein [Candidatus Nitrosotalea sp.]
RADAGRIRTGAPADFVALRIESPEEFGWQFGGNLAAAVFKTGVPIQPFETLASLAPQGDTGS